MYYEIINDIENLEITRWRINFVFYDLLHVLILSFTFKVS